MPDPVASLILWALAVNHESAARLPAALGIRQAELEQFAQEHQPELARMRQLRIAAGLLDRSAMAQLLRVRLAAKLIETEDPRQLAALSNAAIRLPAWVFEEEQPAAAAPQASGGSRSHAAPAGGRDVAGSPDTDGICTAVFNPASEVDSAGSDYSDDGEEPVELFNPQSPGFDNPEDEATWNELVEYERERELEERRAKRSGHPAPGDP